MAMVSGNTSSVLGGMSAKNRISFREDLNTRHCGDDGFNSDEFSCSEDEDDDDETSPSKDPDTAEIASLERKALKYRKSLTMLNQFAGLKVADVGGNAPPASREHMLAAKKSIDDLTAWVNAGLLEGDDDPFDDDDEFDD